MEQLHSQPAKTVVAMHDLSSVGRCALTVAIPVLAAMGADGGVERAHSVSGIRFAGFDGLS